MLETPYSEYVKCTEFESILRLKEISKREEFSQIQRIQNAVDSVMNKVRIAILNGESSVKVPVNKLNHEIEHRILARKVLADAGYKITDSAQKENHQFEYWDIDLTP